MTISPRRILTSLGITESKTPNISFMPRAPLVTDYKNWYVGDIVIDTIALKAYLMMNKTKNTGTWRAITVSNFSITGNVNGTVESNPTTANMFLVGTPTNGINITGNPGTNTLIIGLQSPYSDGNYRFANNLFIGDAPQNTADLEITRNAVRKVETSINNTGNGAAYFSAITQKIGGDPFVKFIVNEVDSFSFGIDNSDSDKLKINQNSQSPSDGTNVWTMTTAGQNTRPLQPCFLAYLDTTTNSVIGTNNASYQLGADTLIKDFDQNSNFNNGIFTAPVKGKYYLYAQVCVTNCTTATNFYLSIVTTKRTYISPVFRKASSLDQVLQISTIDNMADTDTAVVTLKVTGEKEDTIKILGSSTLQTYFTGYLVC